MIRSLLSCLDRRIDARVDARIAAIDKAEIDADWARLDEQRRTSIQGSYERVMADALFAAFPDRRRPE